MIAKEKTSGRMLRALCCMPGTEGVVVGIEKEAPYGLMETGRYASGRMSCVTWPKRSYTRLPPCIINLSAVRCIDSILAFFLFPARPRDTDSWVWKPLTRREYSRNILFFPFFSYRRPIDYAFRSIKADG